MKLELTKSAQIYLALNLDKASALRQIAATVVTRYWMELHHYGEVKDTCDEITRICKRFKLGDYVCALSVHYPIKH